MKKLLIKYLLSFGLSALLASGLFSQGIVQKFGAYSITMDSLNTHTGLQNQYLIVYGAHALNDGYGGVFIYDSLSTATEIPFKVIKPTAITTGRWIAVQIVGAGSGDSSIYNNPDFVVINILTIPPGSPSTGDKYLAGIGSGGAWSAQDNDIETWSGSAWTPTVPVKGQLLINGANDDVLKFDGTNWNVITTTYIFHNKGDNYGAINLSIGNKRNKDFRFLQNNIARGAFVPNGYFNLYYVRDYVSGDSVLTIHNGEVRRAPFSAFSSGASAFTSLTDVPSSYSGQALKLLRVNSGATGLEFFTPTYILPADTTGKWIGIGWLATLVAKQSQLNGTGFVKASGTTISYDNSTYLTTETDPLALKIASNLSDVANAATARNNILPSQTGNNGKVLQTDGSNASWQTVTGGSGSGDNSVVYLDNYVSGNNVHSALLAAYAALPATGGTIKCGSNAFYQLDTVTNFSNASKPVIIQGAGGGLGGGNTGNVTTFKTTLAATSLFYFAAPNSFLNDCFLWNTSSSPTGTAVTAVNDGFNLQRCFIAGFSIGVDIRSGAYSKIEWNTFFCQDHDLKIRDTIAPDNGDGWTDNNVFFSGPASGKSDNIWQKSGGGQKITQNKFNGSLTGINKFYNGDFEQGVTSNINFHHNSLENGYKTGFYLKSNGFFYGNIQYNNNQTSSSLANSCDVDIISVTNVSVNDNVFGGYTFSADTAIKLTSVSVATVDGNSYNGFTGTNAVKQVFNSTTNNGIDNSTLTGSKLIYSNGTTGQLLEIPAGTTGQHLVSKGSGQIPVFQDTTAVPAGGGTPPAPTGYTFHGISGTGSYSDTLIYKDTSANTISLNRSSAPYALTVYPAKPSGTLTFTAFNVNGTGVGTHLLNEVLIGDWIIINGLARQVTGISNNTAITVSSFFTSGTTSGSFRDSTAESRVSMQLKAYGDVSFGGIISSGGNQFNLGSGRMLWYDISNQNTGVGIGATAGSSNRNVSIGYHSMGNGGSFSNSVVEGWGAGEYGSGSNQTLIGYQAAVFNTGGGNTVIGSNAAAASNENSYVGTTAGANSNGGLNAGIGAYNNQYSGSYNAAVGWGALNKSTLSYNTAIGGKSLYSSTNISHTTTQTTAIGYNSGSQLNGGLADDTSCVQCLFLGADTKGSANGVTNETAIGYGAVANGSNTVTIGNSSVTANYFNGVFRLSALNTPPSSSSDTGTTGEIRFGTDGNIYICTATNTWKKFTGSTF